MNNRPGQGKCEHGQKAYDASGVKGQLLFNSMLMLLRKKLVVSSSGEQGRGAAQTTRGVGSPNALLVFKLQSSKFSWMNATSGISTWGRGRPSVVPFASNQNRERISVVNVINFMPTNHNLIERVSDLQSFVKEKYLGSYENKVSGVTSNQSPTQGGNRVQNSVFQQVQQVDHAGRNVNRTSVKVTASGSKKFRICHAPIVPQSMGVAC